MTSSGMKRGLAATAVSALALTGIPFMATSASADSLADQAGGASIAVLYTPVSTGFASVKNDGVNTSVHLLASGGANVIQVQFQWSNPTVAAGAWQNVGGPVSRVNGAFSTEWTPPTGIYNVATTTVRASALNSVGTEIDTADATGVTASSNVESIDIGNASGSSIGVYIDGDSELGAVSGTTSDVGANPALTFNSPSGSGSNTNEDVAGEPAGGVRTYSAPVDFAGYNWDVTAPLVNQAVVYGEAQGSDAEAVTLYEQTITTVTAVADPTAPQAGGDSVVTVTVKDQNGRPVVGANVYQETPLAGPVETNSQGEAEFTVEDTEGDANGTTYAYYVDENDNGTYDSGSEFRRTATVNEYEPTATTITGSSADGAAFDFDEYTAATPPGEGDIKVTVKDQNGANLAGETADLAGKWTVTPFDGSAVYTVNATITDLDDDGLYDVSFPEGSEGTYRLNVWKDLDGTPGETSGDLSMSPLTVKAGEAEIVWDDESVAQRAAGTTATFAAKMMLDDETTLPGRNVSITWSPSGDAVVAAQGAQPANTTRTGNTTATSTTNNAGAFSVAISDPAASPNVNELDGWLDATGTNTTGIGNSAAPADELNVDFLADMAVDTVNSTEYHWNLGNGATPGRPVRVGITVRNADGDRLTDRMVTVTTDHGFFTTPDATDLYELEPAPAAAEGGEYGEWENLGTTFTGMTDDNGRLRVNVAVERDVDFDDDGKLTADVNFAVGGEDLTESVDFWSENPLNPGDLTLQFAGEDDQSVTVLPKAPTTESVQIDMFAEDQFGNLTQVWVDLEDDTTDAEWYTDSDGWNADGYSQFLNDDPEITAYGDNPTMQTITGTWNADTNTWTDGDTVAAGFQEEDESWDGEFGYDSVKHDNVDVVDDAPAIEWYEIDYAASIFTLDQEGAENNSVGTAVTEVFNAVDQNGEPIEDIDVDFYRTGPDDLQDGEGNNWDDTNQNGDAFYTFQGAKAGTAIVTAVPYLDGERIAGGTRTDTVVFGGRTAIEALLKLGNQADGDDVARVNAPSAARGATIKLFKVKRDGTRVLLATKTANANGNAKFVVNDKNGNKFTSYKAKVGQTSRTFADWTPKKRVR